MGKLIEASDRFKPKQIEEDVSLFEQTLLTLQQNLLKDSEFLRKNFNKATVIKLTKEMEIK